MQEAMKCVVRKGFIFANQDPFAKMTWKFPFPACMASESCFNPALLKLSSRPNSNTRKPVSEVPLTNIALAMQSETRSAKAIASTNDLSTRILYT